MDIPLQRQLKIGNVTIGLVGIDFAMSNRKSQRETLDVVTAREDAGLVPLLDVAQARSNLANTEAAIPLLQISLEVALNRLAILLGQAPGTLDEELRKATKGKEIYFFKRAEWQIDIDVKTKVRARFNFFVLDRNTE